MVKWEPGAITTEEYGRGTMVLTLCLSCDTLQSLKRTDVYDAKGLKRSNKHTGSGSSDTFVRLDFKTQTQPALESRHETRAAARLGAQTAAGPLRKYVLHS